MRLFIDWRTSFSIPFLYIVVPPFSLERRIWKMEFPSFLSLSSAFFISADEMELTKGLWRLLVTDGRESGDAERIEDVNKANDDDGIRAAGSRYSSDRWSPSTRSMAARDKKNSLQLCLIRFFFFLPSQHTKSIFLSDVVSMKTSQTKKRRKS